MGIALNIKLTPRYLNGSWLGVPRFSSSWLATLRFTSDEKRPAPSQQAVSYPPSLILERLSLSKFRENGRNFRYLWRSSRKPAGACRRSPRGAPTGLL